jgi:hypothetical protein
MKDRIEYKNSGGTLCCRTLWFVPGLKCKYLHIQEKILGTNGLAYYYASPSATQTQGFITMAPGSIVRFQ